MKNYKCNKCNLEVPNSTHICQNCGLKAIEYVYLKVELIDNNHNQILENFLNDGFEIVRRNQFIEETDERDILSIKYELQKAI